MSGALIPLRAGTENHPLFMAHGMGGSVYEFADLVRFIRTEQCIYGLQAKGNDGMEEPFERIEDLARHHLDAIKRIQTRGPYFLLGFSLGGLVALEMAHQLCSSGEIVALLAMLDSYPHPRQLSWWQRTRLTLRRNKGRAVSATPAQDTRPTDQPVEIMRHAYNCAYKAWSEYQLRVYPGKIHFVKAEVATIYPEDPIAVWSKLASDFEVQTVPGDHHEILTTHSEFVGSILSGYLTKSSEDLR